MMREKKEQWPGWETTQLIGRGSFGAVYEIERRLFEDDEPEKAALKVISIPQNDSDIEEMYNDGYDEESVTSTFHSHLKSIVAEYSLMRKMNGSSNIVNCDDVRYIQHDDGIGWDIYIKMELLTPLAKALPAKVSEEQIIKIAKDMCAALELCSKHNIIHRDIKPQNIFVSENGDYKLGDFGIAKTVEKTMGGTKTGTYKYMAPEVYSNRPYNSTADIYSLGLVLYWLLNERRMPFMPLPPEKLRAGMDEESRNRRFAGEKIPAPKNGSEELKRIVLKACAYDPKDRYQSAREMREDLLRLYGEYAPVQNVQNSMYVSQQKTDDVDATVGTSFGHASQNGQFDATEKTVGPVFGTKVNKDSFEEEKTVGPVFAEQKKQKTEKKRRKIWPAIVAAACIVIAVLVVVFGMGKKTPDNVLMADVVEIQLDDSGHLISQPVFGSDIKRDQIKTITFLDSLKNAPDSAWDVSEARDGSVKAWVEPTGKLYDLFIAGKSGVALPENCSTLFALYINLESIEFNDCVASKNAIDMARMFYYCEKLEELDLTWLDTSCVISMHQMFTACSSLTMLDVSSFNTANVQTMAGMFTLCSNLERLDITGFDTSGVKDMSNMFMGCPRLFVWNEDLQQYERFVGGFEGLESLDCSNVTSWTNFVPYDIDHLLVNGRPWIYMFVDEVRDITLEIWAEEDDYMSETSWLKTQLSFYEELHPEYNITWSFGTCLPGDAGLLVQMNGPENSADIYFFSNNSGDEMNRLISFGALAPLADDAADWIRNAYSDTYINCVTHTDGKIYGYPMEPNTWFMYYNKEVFNEEDIKSLDTMLEKGRVAFPVKNSWYLGSFFVANGGMLFGDTGKDAAAGIQFGADHGGVDVALKLIDLLHHPNFMDDANSAQRMLLNGDTDAIFSGAWDYDELMQILGDNLGCAQLPTVNINGQEKQLRALAGAHCIGVNPNSSDQDVALEVANYLASSNSQWFRYYNYDNPGTIPAHDEVVKGSELVNAVTNTMNYTSIAQPTIAEMNYYWGPMGVFGTDLAEGRINKNNVSEAINELMKGMNP